MRAISLIQPWASLIVYGLKRIETRSWRTSYHGPLLIHASKTRAYMEHLDILAKGGHLPPEALDPARYPFGALVGSVRLVHCAPTDWFLKGTNRISQGEEALGDYSPGRFGWVLRDPVAFAEPVPCKGALGLWEVPTDLLPPIGDRG